MRPPNAVQIELVEGCNRICSFCGINAIRSKLGDYCYMTPETAALVAAGVSELNPKARLEFAMHGEPLQHPQADILVAIFARMMPKAQLMVTTNGRVMLSAERMQRKLDMLFAAGVHFVMLDTYREDRDQLLAAASKLKGITVRDWYRDLMPVKWSPYAHHQGKVQRLLVLMDDIGERSGEHGSRTLSNHSGSNPLGAKVEQPMKRTCTKPFRELAVCWDGEVRLCCEDWTGAYVCGNASTEPLSSIWGGQAFEAARRMLQGKRRDFGACRRCDARAGARVGLLPKYPPPDASTVAVVRRTELPGTLVPLARNRR